MFARFYSYFGSFGPFEFASTAHAFIDQTNNYKIACLRVPGIGISIANVETLLERRKTDDKKTSIRSESKTLNRVFLVLVKRSKIQYSGR